MDVDATASGKAIDYEYVKVLAEECFMPLCYGGGIANIEQARRLFSIGVEKVSIQSAALDNPELILAIAQEFGSQSIAVSIDVATTFFGKYQLYQASSKEHKKKPWLEHIKRCVDLGAGEVILTSVKHEGLLKGIDQKLISDTAKELSVPLVAGGGISSLDDIKLAIQSGASAVAVGSFFIFHGPHRAVLVSVPAREIIEAKLGDIL